MSKNAEGWIRHNNKKQPVDDHVEVEIRTRGGDYEVCKAYGFACDATDENQIMAYRLHKPAGQIEIIEYSGSLEPASSDHLSRFEGPLQWRDRITTIDFDIKDLTTERAELVQKLASEGFALIGRVVEPVEDMSDWRNWKEGDRIEVISKGFDGRDIGEMLTVDGLDNDDANQPVGVMGDDKTHSWPIVSRGHFLCIKWHSRPSA